MNRYQASLAHFAISLAIATLVFFAVRFAWYPGALFEVAGGLDLLLLIVFVDVTLGPLITLIIFVPGKKGLKFDLVTIALVQLAALVYGFWAIAESRPIFVAFVKDRFELVRAIDIEDKDLAKGAEATHRSASWIGPRYVGAKLPKDPAEQFALMISALAGKDLHTYPKYYVAYETVAADAAAKGAPMARLRSLNPDRAAEVDELISGSGRAESALAFLPMRAGKRDLTVVVDAKSGQVVRLAPLRPWEY